jgi:hypothetical protein
MSLLSEHNFKWGKKKHLLVWGMPKLFYLDQRKKNRKEIWGLNVGGIHSNLKDRFVGDFLSVLILFL